MSEFVRPQVVAHRGASSKVAEHTLAAYEAAIADGAQALECDVRLTSDGHLVCVHDSKINRTSDGRGRVSNKRLTELMDRDFMSWWTPQRSEELGLSASELPEYDHEERTVLTLDRLLELIDGTDVELAVETKHPMRYGGYLEQSVVETLDRYGMLPRPGTASQVRVMSFAPVAMRRMSELAPEVPTVFLLDQPVKRRFRTGYVPGGARIVGPSIALLREQPKLVEQWQADGVAIHVWVVDDYDDVRFACRTGVAALITNRPARVGQWLDEFGESGL